MRCRTRIDAKRAYLPGDIRQNDNPPGPVNEPGGLFVPFQDRGTGKAALDLRQDPIPAQRAVPGACCVWMPPCSEERSHAKRSLPARIDRHTIASFMVGVRWKGREADHRDTSFALRVNFWLPSVPSRQGTGGGRRTVPASLNSTWAIPCLSYGDTGVDIKKSPAFVRRGSVVLPVVSTFAADARMTQRPVPFSVSPREPRSPRTP